MLAGPPGPRREVDRVAGFLFRLERMEGTPAEPPMARFAVPN
jgi:hypothetical protein